MPSPEIRRNATAIAALIVPVLAVKITTVVMGHPTTRQASAEPKPVEATATPTATAKAKPLTQQQIAAMQHIQTLRTQPFGPAPVRAEHAAVTTSQPLVTEVEPQVIPTAAQPEFAVTAVMSSNSIVSGPDGTPSAQPTRRALINGRPYRQGETIKGTTWKVMAIDCVKRSVTLRDTRSDRTVTVNVELPQ